MKAFSVYQPFAFSIVAGIKPHETRSRRTNIRGRVAVHAGMKEMDGALKSFTEAEREKIIAMLHQPPFIDNVLCRGGIVGTVEIVNCIPVEEVVNTLTERERLLGDYSPGRFAWVLKNPVMFDEPFPARGQQGWWEWDEIEACKSRIKKATYQLGLNFFNGVTPGSAFPPANILQAEAAVFLNELNRAQEIMIGPTEQDITLGDISLDILPLIPGAFQEISDRGTYRVYQYGELIGTVTYSGPPRQGAPGTVKIGTETAFIPRKAAEHIEITVDFGKESENT